MQTKKIPCFIFFLSGAAALIFESLWFRLAGLTFGNSVVAAAVVMAGFMGGLGLGSGLIAFLGHKINFPMRFYALLECAIAVSGIALVFAFPHLTQIFVNVFCSLLEKPLQLNLVRTVFAVGLMVVPAAAMGATLPVLIKALYAKEENFGRALGLLYGWNTLGAVAGVLLNELFLIKWFGIQGTGIFAAFCNIISAGIAWTVFQKSKTRISKQNITNDNGLKKLIVNFSFMKLLMAGFLSGMSMLALEVVWFRFLLLFMYGHSWNFAMMLAIVLAGISCGGLIACRLFSVEKDSHEFLVPVAALSGIFIVVLYSQFDAVYYVAGITNEYTAGIICAGYMMFPVSLLSGMIFTMLGRALYQQIPVETASSGLLTLFNTVGAMCGALCGGLLLLPRLGIEKSFALLAFFYGAIMVLLFEWKAHFSSRRKLLINCSLMGLFLFCQLIFPYGKMEKTFLTLKLGEFYEKEAKRIGFYEGESETIQYFQVGLCGRPYYYEQFTNSFPMGNTSVNNRRFAKSFVFLPVAMHPQAEDALLIAYGCGSTAKALTDTKSLKNISVVDISKGIIRTSKAIYNNPKDDPIADPRVKVYIEDARFFLQTTREQFDIITGEPPPPKGSGLANLYSEEYFQLIYERLKPGGVVTYYLPSYRLEVCETKAVLKAFSNVFENCSLWTGMGFEWMMVGIKEPYVKVSQELFSRQWHIPDVRGELTTLGFDSPEEISACFIADRERILSWIKDSEPLKDNFPYRISPYLVKEEDVIAEYGEFMNPEKAADNFTASRQIKAIWPQQLHYSAKEFFKTNTIINSIFHNLQPWVKNLDYCLAEPFARKYILWALVSDADAQKIISESRVDKQEEYADAYKHLAAKAILDGKYIQAENYYRLAKEKENKINYNYYYLRMYLLASEGKRAQAELAGEEFINLFEAQKNTREMLISGFFSWYDKAAAHKY